MTVVRSCFLIGFLAILPDSRSRRRTVVKSIFIPDWWSSLFRSTALMRRFILLLRTRSWSSLRVVSLFRPHFPFRLIFTAPVIFRLLKSLMIRFICPSVWPSIRAIIQEPQQIETNGQRILTQHALNMCTSEFQVSATSLVNSSKNHCIFRSPFACSAGTSIFVFLLTILLTDARPRRSNPKTSSA